MSDKKTYWKVSLDDKTEIALKKIIDVKGITIQSLLEHLLKNYVFDNLDCLISDGSKQK